jgi:hypothetical protein
MKKTKMAIGLLLIMLMMGTLGGCAYVDIRAPYDSNLDNTDLGTKVGTADAYSIFWLVAWGDASYAAAARNGNIKVLKHADQKIQEVLLGLFTHWQVIVYGD